MSNTVKLIIEIPSIDYEYLKNNCIIPIKYDNHIYEAILHGTPLDDIKALSVPEREKGEWIAYDHGMGLVYLKCPFCGVTIDKRHVEHNFCGKCGAKLSGEKSGFERRGKE